MGSSDSKENPEPDQERNQRRSNVDDYYCSAISFLKNLEKELLKTKNLYEKKIDEIKAEIADKTKMSREIELKNHRAEELHKIKMQEYMKKKTLYEKEINCMKVEIANMTDKSKAIKFQNHKAEELHKTDMQGYMKMKISCEKEIDNINAEIDNKKKISKEITLNNRKAIELHKKKIEIMEREYKTKKTQLEQEMHLMKQKYEKEIDNINAKIDNKMKMLKEITLNNQKAVESHTKKIEIMEQEYETKKTQFEQEMHLIEQEYQKEKSLKADDKHQRVMDRHRQKTITELILKNSPDKFKSRPFGEVHLDPCPDIECRVVKSWFMMTTQPHFCILSVFKIVNPYAMVNYILKKKYYQLSHGEENVTEQLLFRGIENVDLKNLNASIYKFRNEWSQNKQYFQSTYWTFTPISNYANRRCGSTLEKFMILATVLTCKDNGTKNSHSRLCNLEVELKTDQKGRLRRTHFKFNIDEFYPTYLIKFSGQTLR